MASASPLPFSLPPRRSLDAPGLEARAARFTRRGIKNESKRAGLKLAVSMMDLTTLEGADTPGKVRALCQKAWHPMPDAFAVPSCAAVCVYPTLVREACRLLEGSGVAVASVATGFPSGQYPRDQKLDDVRFAVAEGAGEIDMVISRGAFLAGHFESVAEEIAAVKTACGEAHLKVILETGELGTYEDVRFASDLAIAAGADFVKTSTGKVSPAATLPVTLILLESVRDHFLATGRRIGVKPAGGIRHAKEALQYLVMVKEVLGDDWLTPALFRFGASSLLGDVILQLARLEDGAYQSPRYFSQP